MPSFSAPKLDAPSMPSFKAPSFDMPKMDASPSVELMRRDAAPAES